MVWVTTGERAMMAVGLEVVLEVGEVGALAGGEVESGGRTDVKVVAYAKLQRSFLQF